MNTATDVLVTVLGGMLDRVTLIGTAAGVTLYFVASYYADPSGSSELLMRLLGSVQERLRSNARPIRYARHKVWWAFMMLDLRRRVPASNRGDYEKREISALLAFLQAVGSGAQRL